MIREQQDTLSLSFTDVLTCVFGAAVALFLIFVSIVQLSGTSTQSSLSDLEGNVNATARSMILTEKAGYAISEIRIISEDEDIIRAITPTQEPQKTLNLELNEDVINCKKSQECLYGVVFRYHQVMLSPHEFILTKTEGNLSGNVYVTVLIGGMVEQYKLKLIETNSNSELFSVLGNRLPFVSVDKSFIELEP